MSLEQNKHSTPISYFAPTGKGSDQLLQYPFAHPEGSFMTDGEVVTVLPNDPTAFFEAAGQMLAERGLPSLSQRIPVLAYGANWSPARFSEKMDTYGPVPPEMQADLQTAPMLAVTVPDVEVVWHGGIGQTGSTFAELYRGPEVEGTAAAAVIQYLTPEQFAKVSASEGETYNVTIVPVTGEDGTTIKAIGFTAGQSDILLKNGKPVRVEAPDRETDSDNAMTARQAVAFMLENAGQAIGFRDPEQLIEANTKPGVSFAEKLARQRGVNKLLAEIGLLTEFSYVDENGNTPSAYGRVEFTGLQTPGHTPYITRESDGKHLPLVQMPEMVLARLQPPKEQLRVLIKDEADAIQARAVQRGKLVTRKRAEEIAAQKFSVVHKLRDRAITQLARTLDIAKMDNK